ncbi:MAG TPA: TlpA family protein disulfide reductase [Gammaproteobacteria bacterium]|nr:TlpA family protein disulfide reductase [Gammaproteobacteria bacterium]
MISRMSKIKSFIKERFILFIFFFTIFFSACSKPDYEIFNGSSGYLEDLQGKWLIVNYWADWCPPCIKEMPELSSFYSNNHEQVNVFAYNFDRLEGQELQEQIIRFKVNVPSILTDPGKLFGWESPQSLPVTFIVDPKGNTRGILIGAQTREKLELLIEKYKES